MSALDVFHHCPRCAAPLPEHGRPNAMECPGCGLVLFVNPASAAAAFVVDPSGRVLLIRRLRDPGRGRLAPPGGFIDAGETAEDALRRELREEVGLDVRDLEFLCSQPNRYSYAGVSYDVLDLFFIARTGPGAQARPLDEVASVAWHDPSGITPGELAFPSMQAAWHRFRERLDGPREGPHPATDPHPATGPS